MSLVFLPSLGSAVGIGAQSFLRFSSNLLTRSLPPLFLSPSIKNLVCVSLPHCKTEKSSSRSLRFSFRAFSFQNAPGAEGEEGEGGLRTTGGTGK